MSLSISEIGHRNGHVYVNVRQWDGIDRPDVFQVSDITPEQAFSLASRLETAGAQARAFRDQKAKDELADKRKRLESLKGEVAALEAEVGSDD